MAFSPFGEGLPSQAYLVHLNSTASNAVQHPVSEEFTVTFSLL